MNARLFCRWAGDHFEKATQEEHQRLGGISRLSSADFDRDENGWSRRTFVAGPIDRSFTVEASDQFRLLVNNRGVTGTKNGTLLIDLLRPGKASERIGVFETREGRVTKAEYQHAFRDPE